MQKLEGVTCCVLVAWQRWLPALPRWSPLLQAAAWLARAILQHSCKDISPSLMRSITIRRYPSEAKFDAPTDFDKTLHQMSDTPIRTAEDALALIEDMLEGVLRRP